MNSDPRRGSPELERRARERALRTLRAQGGAAAAERHLRGVLRRTRRPRRVSEIRRAIRLLVLEQGMGPLARARTHEAAEAALVRLRPPWLIVDLVEAGTLAMLEDPGRAARVPVPLSTATQAALLNAVHHDLRPRLLAALARHLGAGAGRRP